MTFVYEGIPVFEPQHLDTTAPFWRGLDEGVLRLPRCLACSTWQWYPLPACSSCRAGAPTWVNAPTTGTVFTWTTARRSFLPAADVPVPYHVGLVALDGVEGPRLVSVLTGLVDVEPFIGMRVRMEIVDVGTHRLPVFVPIGEDQ